jgi:hypothetical protein
LPISWSILHLKKSLGFNHEDFSINARKGKAGVVNIKGRQVLVIGYNSEHYRIRVQDGLEMGEEVAL